MTFRAVYMLSCKINTTSGSSKNYYFMVDANIIAAEVIGKCFHVKLYGIVYVEKLLGLVKVLNGRLIKLATYHGYSIDPNINYVDITEDLKVENRIVFSKDNYRLHGQRVLGDSETTSVKEYLESGSEYIRFFHTLGKAKIYSDERVIPNKTLLLGNNFINIEKKLQVDDDGKFI